MTTLATGVGTAITRNNSPILGQANALPALTFLQPNLTSPYTGSDRTLQSSPSWFRTTSGLPYSAFSSSLSTLALPLFVLPGGGVVHGIKIVASQSFLGGSIATYTISVGTSSTPALLASPFSVFGAPLSTNFQLSSNFYEFDEVNSTTIVAQAVCTGDVLANATQGAVDIYALLSMAF